MPVLSNRAGILFSGMTKKRAPIKKSAPVCHAVRCFTIDQLPIMRMRITKSEMKAVMMGIAMIVSMSLP